MKKIAISVLLLCVFVLPSQATAAQTVQAPGWISTLTDQQVSDPMITVAMAASEQYWGRPLPCGTVTWFVATSAPDPTFAASPTTPRPSPPAGFGDAATCRAWIDLPAINPPGSDPRYGDYRVCKTVSHEYGHLLGHYEHGAYSDDPAGVMQAVHAGAPTCPNRPPPGETADAMFMRLHHAAERKARGWCRRHKPRCIAKRPKLARRALKHPVATPRRRG